MSALEHVFQPFDLNRLRARNRVFVPAHTTNFGAAHMPTDHHVEYHRARARGGAALVIFEAIRVMENTLGRPPGCREVERLTGIDTLIACIPLGPRTRSKRRSSR